MWNDGVWAVGTVADAVTPGEVADVAEEARHPVVTQLEEEVVGEIGDFLGEFLFADSAHLQMGGVVVDYMFCNVGQEGSDAVFDVVGADGCAEFHHMPSASDGIDRVGYTEDDFLFLIVGQRSGADHGEV